MHVPSHGGEGDTLRSPNGRVCVTFDTFGHRRCGPFTNCSCLFARGACLGGVQARASHRQEQPNGDPLWPRSIDWAKRHRDCRRPRSLCTRILSCKDSTTASCKLLLLFTSELCPACAPLQRASAAPATWARRRAPSLHARAHHENCQRFRPPSPQPTCLARAHHHGRLHGSDLGPSRNAGVSGHHLRPSQLFFGSRPPRRAVAGIHSAPSFGWQELTASKSFASKE